MVSLWKDLKMYAENKELWPADLSQVGKYLQHFFSEMANVSSEKYRPTTTDIYICQQWIGSNANLVFLEKRWYKFLNFKFQEIEDFSEELQRINESHNIIATVYFVDLEKIVGKDGCRILNYSKHHFLKINKSLFSEKKRPLMLYIHNEEQLNKKLTDPIGFKLFQENFPEYKGGPETKDVVDFVTDQLVGTQRIKKKIKIIFRSIHDPDSLNHIWHTLKKYHAEDARTKLGF